MFGFIDDIVKTVVDVPASLFGLSERNTQTVKNLALTGLSVYEIVDITGFAVDAVQDIMED